MSIGYRNVNFVLSVDTLDRLSELCKLHRMGEADIISKALASWDEQSVFVDVLNEHCLNQQKSLPANKPSSFFKSAFGLE